MGFARGIGRVGALAGVLGVGVAVATCPAIGHGAPTDSGSSGSDSWAEMAAPSGGSYTAWAAIPGASLPGPACTRSTPPTSPTICSMR